MIIFPDAATDEITSQKLFLSDFLELTISYLCNEPRQHQEQVCRGSFLPHVHSSLTLSDRTFGLLVRRGDGLPQHLTHHSLPPKSPPMEGSNLCRWGN